MKWNKYTLRMRTEAVDFVGAALAELGIEGIEIEDRVALSEEETRGMFIDILPDRGEDTGEASISFYLDGEKEKDGRLREVEAALKEVSLYCDIGEGELLCEETEDKDWINNWKEFFKPFLIEDILIKPSWEKIPEDLPHRTMIEIDPGTAFGTGGHETTRLCIRGLRDYINAFGKDGRGQGGLRVLDIGTGSGILGIAALKLGADYVFATDIDTQVFESVRENMRANGIAPEAMEMKCMDILDGGAAAQGLSDRPYDIVTANILAPVIIELQKKVPAFLKKGGVFISSGIIDSKEGEVRAAIEANPGLELLEVRRDGEWVSIVARKA